MTPAIDAKGCPSFDSSPRFCAGCALPSPVPTTLARGWTQWGSTAHAERPSIWCPTCSTDGILHANETTVAYRSFLCSSYERQQQQMRARLKAQKKGTK